jgi:hypothetical protein
LSCISAAAGLSPLDEEVDGEKKVSVEQEEAEREAKHEDWRLWWQRERFLCNRLHTYS